ncbi:MAG: Protein GrpE [candidate division Kazan bacterium GW2011_GWC1_52_13]|nr:MAG: Protein GrpE [candidate division Kazan bacterium GW2011_GWC1_52_13]KKW26981.1 MAG: Protein GrpE [candidate division Kazan bacterium GW2011_GWB1_52_7]
MDKKHDKKSESAKEQLVDWEDVAKRAMADLDNYRKDAEKRQMEMVQFLKANSLIKFLEIYDDLNRAVEFVTDEKAKQGLLEVQKKFKDYLHQDGLDEIEFKAGDEFNPILAEAVSYEENEVGEGKVIETLEVGLKYNDRVIKPARVRVAK